MLNQRRSTSSSPTSCTPAQNQSLGTDQNQGLPCDVIKEEDQASEPHLKRLRSFNGRVQVSPPALLSRTVSQATGRSSVDIDPWVCARQVNTSSLVAEPQSQSTVMDPDINMITTIRSHIAMFCFECRFDEDAARADILEYSKRLLREQSITKLHDRIRDVSDEYVRLLMASHGKGYNVSSWKRSILDVFKLEPSTALRAIGGIILLQINTQNARYGERYKQQRRRAAGASPNPPESYEEINSQSHELPTAGKSVAGLGRTSPDNERTHCKSPPHKRARHQTPCDSVSIADSIVTVSTDSSSLASAPAATIKTTLVHAAADSTPEKTADCPQASASEFPQVLEKTQLSEKTCALAANLIQSVTPTTAPAVQLQTTPASFLQLGSKLTDIPRLAPIETATDAASEQTAVYHQASTVAISPDFEKKLVSNTTFTSTPTVVASITPTAPSVPPLRAHVYFDTKLYPVAEAEASKKLRRIVSTVDGFLRQVEATINDGVTGSVEIAREQADWLRDAVATDLQ